MVAAAVVASAMVGAAAWTLKPTPPLTVTRFAFALGEGQQFTVVNNQTLAVSPDGTLLVYVANNQLYLRSMSDLEARPIPGTQQTPGLFNPVFSPDSRSIAFFAPSDHTIKKIAVSGGAAVTICPAGPVFYGMTWDSSGIVFGQGAQGIMRVSANGGQPTVLVSVKDGELAHGPQVLPGGEWVLFTVATAATADGWDKAQIVVQSLKSSERKTLVSGGSDGRYLPTGHLVYALGGVLFAVPFDLRQLAVTGGPVPIVEGVRRSASRLTGAAHFSVSSTGSLVFVPGPVSTSAAQSDLALVDRNGTPQLLKLPPGPYEYPRLSPDGKRVAFGSDDGKDAIVWIYELSGTSSMRRLTSGGRNRVPVWSADGERVAFQSDRDGDLGIFWQRADGTTAAERLTKPDKDTAHVPESWSPDGKTLLFSVAKGSSYAVAAFSLTDKKVTPFGGIQSPFLPAATFSPDGRWVAYSAGEAGAAAGFPIRPAVSSDRREVSDLENHRHPSHVVSRWEGAVLLCGRGPIRGGERHDAADLHLRQPGAGAGTFRRARPRVRAKQRHHARRQAIPRRRRCRTNRVRRARRSSDSGRAQLVRRAEGARADEVASRPGPPSTAGGPVTASGSRTYRFTSALASK